MRTRARNPFTTVSTAGLLLPVDLLTRIVEADPDLPGLSPQDYHLRSGERLNEAASRAWNECLAAWKSFRKKFATLPASDTGTTLTRDEWLLPLFQELGYGRLQTKKAIVIDEREYPVSHGWEEHVPIHLLSARYPLDRRSPGVSGAATRSPYSMLQELLNRSGKHRWGFLSNGLKVVLLRDNASLARAANVEFDLEAMLDGEVYADFLLLFLLCHQSRVEIQPVPIATPQAERKAGAAKKKAKPKRRKTAEVEDDAESDEDEESADAEAESASQRLGPENCWLERWANQAHQQGTRARERLRDGVEAAIKALGAGFLTTRGNEPLREQLRSGTLSTQDYYRQLLRLVYRVLMLLVAEEKRTETGDNLLHPSGVSRETRERYARFYSVGRLRTLAGQRRGTAHPDLYESLMVLFLKLREGYAPLGIPGFGSFLFSPRATPDLDSALLGNEHLLDAIRQLCFTEDATGRGSGVRRPVDFGNLGSEELGSVYESLLELHPLIDSDEGPFTLKTAAGHERKTTGSYYTPRSLINCLLDSALDPVVKEAIDKPDPRAAEEALLNLKVCDPACGSGHFLIAAAERMATHLARLRTGDDQPGTLAVQHAKRDIIGRCIYGVDLNPMAVELCKVSLWMEALEPGKPLSFLDHHIQCGNSLLGTTPALLAKGIPDAAFTPIEGDDKAVCSELKKDNKRERKDFEQGYRDFHFPIDLGNLPAEFARLTGSTDESVADSAAKEQRYAELVKGVSYRNARLLADAWCAAFVWKKDRSSLGRLCPTERGFRNLQASPDSVLPHVRAEIERLRDQYQFLHWHLAFPDILRLSRNNDTPDNARCGWNGGFSAIVGNPPWEMIELSEKEFFAERSTEIATASTARKRKQLINELEANDLPLFTAYRDALRHLTGVRHLIQSSERYPTSSAGRVNLYPIFAELYATLIAIRGRAGVIVPSAISTDAYNAQFFTALVNENRLRSLFDFENRDGIFSEVHRSYRFCLLTLQGPCVGDQAFEFCYFCHSTAELSDPSRRISLTKSQLALFSPNTLAPPILQNRKDFLLALKAYEENGVLSNHSAKLKGGWKATVQRMLSLSDPGDLFRKQMELEPDERRMRWHRLFSGKAIHQFNHRFSTFAEGGWQNVSPADLCRPDFKNDTEYYVLGDQVERRLRDKSPSEWLIGYRDIARATDEVSVIATIIPKCGCDTTFRNIFVAPDEICVVPALVGNLNSYTFNFFARQKVIGTHLNAGTMEQLPVLAQSRYHSSVFGSVLLEWIVGRVLELSNTAWDMEPFALDCGYDGPPFRWDEDRRFLIRCELDAAYFHLYLGTNDEWRTQGTSELLEAFPTPRDAVSYIMDTFPIVRRKDEQAHGEYRTKRAILEIYDAMAEAIRTGAPYQTRLNPPPGPPADAEGNFLSLPEWAPGHPRPADWPPHIHPPREVALRRTTAAQVQRGRASAYVQLLLHEWGIPAERGAIEVGLILMLNDSLRAAILKGRSPPAGEATIVRGMDEFLGSMRDSRFVVIEDTGARQLIRLGPAAAGGDSFLPEDRRRAKETVEAVRKVGEDQVRIALNEVAGRAEFELVS